MSRSRSVLALTLALLTPSIRADVAQEAYLKAANTQRLDQFGFAVAASGDTLVVGAPLKEIGRGAVYVFERDGSGWIPDGTLLSSNAEIGDQFGCSVAICGDTMVVGAYGEDSNGTGVNSRHQGNNSFGASGAAYVFVRQGGLWRQQAYLKASNTQLDDNFGTSSPSPATRSWSEPCRRTAAPRE